MDINTALVAAIGRMQSKMEKQRVHIRKLEEQRSYVMTANAGLRDTIDEHNRIFEHDRKEHAAQLGAANVKYEIEINNMRKERSNLILDRDWWRETAHAVAKKYEDTIAQLREKAQSTETQINGLKRTMRDMAVLIIAYEAGHRWDADARDMIRQYAGCDWMQQARSDFKHDTNVEPEPTRAFKDVTIGEYFNWQGRTWKKEGTGHSRIPGTGTTMVLADDALVTRTKDQSLQPCRGCGQYFSVLAAANLGGDETLCAAGCGKPKPNPDSIVPGQHTFSPIEGVYGPDDTLPATEGRPFGRNEHEAEEYKPPVIKLEDTIRQIDGAMNAEVYERLARLEQRVMNHEERIKHIDAVQEEVGFRVLPPLQERVQSLEDGKGTARRFAGVDKRIEALEQRTHTHAPDDGK
jgi:hypothetical protein